MIWFIIAAIFLAVVGIVLLFKRDFGPTRSVAHVLYDTEHQGEVRRK